MQTQISQSTRADKKLQAVIDNQKTIHFGSKGASDFTLNRDKAHKGRYERRRKKREGRTAGFYAKNILWNKPTIQASIKGTNQKFKGLHITYKNRP